MTDALHTPAAFIPDKPLILASASPRRQELMTLAGFNFTVLTGNGDEHTDKVLPCDVVCELSRRKALEAAALCDSSCYIIGADTIVSLDSSILGKPKTAERASKMLKSLQGRAHQVYTGVTIAEFCGKSLPVRTHTFYECTDVNVCSMSDTEISAYVATGEPLDKAGGYGIQGSFCIYVSSISGDYYNVVGLPIARLYHELLSFTKRRGCE